MGARAGRTNRPSPASAGEGPGVTERGAGRHSNTIDT
jgi:hypothetical protein